MAYPPPHQPWVPPDERWNQRQPEQAPPTEQVQQVYPGYNAPPPHMPPPRHAAPQPPPPAPSPKPKRSVFHIIGIIFTSLILLGILLATCSRQPAPTSGQTGPRTGSSSGSTQSLDQTSAAETATAPQPNSLTTGQTANLDGLQVTVEPLTRDKGLTGPLLCSKVTYVNNSSDNVTANALFDWKMQGPDAVIENPQIFGGDKGLSTVELAPGGKVAGNVCFKYSAAKGEYSVLYDAPFSGNDEIRWTEVR